MHLDRKKIVFGSIIVLLLAFIMGYYFWVVENSPVDQVTLEQPEVPQADSPPKEFESRKEAVDAIEEPRKTTSQELYDERDLQKWDSNYSPTQEDYGVQEEEGSYEEELESYPGNSNKVVRDHTATQHATIQGASSMKVNADVAEIMDRQRAFFSDRNESLAPGVPGLKIRAAVNGRQTVSSHERLELRLLEETIIGETTFSENTLIYAFASFKTHRVFLEISYIGTHPISLKAYDAQDGREGIYIKNSYRQQAGQEVMEDVASGVNIPGFPQLGGVKQVFRRSNRAVKVTIHDHYLIYLQSEK